MIDLRLGDCRERLEELPDNSVDSIVTDPPYELGFMGKGWDKTGIAYDSAVWTQCLRVLKPGGHLLSFGGTRTYHRMVCAIEDAGFEIRDEVLWVYGSGFPKSLDISKAIDKAAGTFVEGEETANSRHGIEGDENGYNHSKVARASNPQSDAAKQWQGWGTALKPAHESIVLARKPLEGTVAANVLKYGVGGLNIDGCRVGTEDTRSPASMSAMGQNSGWNSHNNRPVMAGSANGRFPANLITDGSEEVSKMFPNDAARFFYSAKASPQDRNEGLEGFEEVQQDESRKEGNPGGDNPRNRGVHKRANPHPTVKPVDLMCYLCRLVTPKGGTVLDPFMGSGSTGKAAQMEGFNFIGIELDPDYFKIAKARIENADNLFTQEAA
jgi:site-specific DNA-methyltransferase (adenine-specific)